MKQPIVALAICVGAVIAFSAPAFPDEGKDESGKGWYDDYEDRGDWHDEYYYEKGPRRHGKHVKIPYGHLPPPGECRDWYADLPPGHQPPPYRC
jgi:hypothetical protein